MEKKSAISGEYLIQVEDSGSVIVCRIFDNVKASLREIAEKQALSIAQIGRHDNSEANLQMP